MPFTELEPAMQDSLRSATRPSYHTDLGSQPTFSANVTCLALSSLKADDVTTSCTSALLQVVNLYGTHRLLPAYFIPLVIKLFTVWKPKSTQGLRQALETQHQNGNTSFDSYNLEMVMLVLSSEGLNSEMVKLCVARLLVIFEKDSEALPDLDSQTCVRVLGVLTNSGKLRDTPGVIERLIKHCTDTSLLDRIGSSILGSLMLDPTRYQDNVLILTKIALKQPLTVTPRVLVSVVQCVLCESGNFTVSLQFLYIQYIRNPEQLIELLDSRFDVLACLSSHIRYNSPNLNMSLLFLLTHLNSRYQGECEGIVLEIANIVEILEATTSPLTLTLSWRLFTNFNLLSDHHPGLKHLALKSLLEPDHGTSLAAGMFLECGECGAPWVGIAVQTSLLLRDIPSGVIWVLSGFTDKVLRGFVEDRVNHVVKCLSAQFHSQQQVVIMKLMSRLFELFPEHVSSVLDICEPRSEEGGCLDEEWVTMDVIVHRSALDVISQTKCAEIRTGYSKILNYFKSNCQKT